MLPFPTSAVALTMTMLKLLFQPNLLLITNGDTSLKTGNQLDR